MTARIVQIEQKEIDRFEYCEVNIVQQKPKDNSQQQVENGGFENGHNNNSS